MACERDLLNEEFYKPMIYLKSGDNNIFPYPHQLNDSVTTGFMTVGSGGSMPLRNDVFVTIERDDEILEKYNYRFYGNELNKYAKVIPDERFVIPSFDLVIKAGDVTATTFFPIEIDVNGLSPDTTYMLAVRIKSAEGVEINEDKDYVMYKVELENAYSSMSSRMYKLKGIKTENEIMSNITTNKTLLPISKNQVRLFPENIATSTDLKKIEDQAILLVVNEDNSVRVKPYKNIEIEQLDDCVYDHEEKMFIINYKYRMPGSSKWITVMEMLTRVE